MWRIGFRLWSAWQYIRLGVPGSVLALLVLMGQGFTSLFWLLVVLTGSVVFGARVVLTRLGRKEPSSIRKVRRR